LEKGHLLAPSDFGITHQSIYEGFEDNAQKYPDHPCLGTRVGDEFKWISYALTFDKVNNFAKGMLKENMTPKGEDGQRNSLGIYAINQEGWTVANFACMRINSSIVTLYSTLGAEALVFCCN